MSKKEWECGFEDGRTGRERDSKGCNTYLDGWREGVKFRTASAHVRWVSMGALSFKEFRELSQLPARTIRDWFASPTHRPRLDCMIAGAVALKASDQPVAQRINGVNSDENDKS